MNSHTAFKTVPDNASISDSKEKWHKGFSCFLFKARNIYFLTAVAIAVLAILLLLLFIIIIIIILKITGKRSPE